MSRIVVWMFGLALWCGCFGFLAFVIAFSIEAHWIHNPIYYAALSVVLFSTLGVGVAWLAVGLLLLFRVHWQRLEALCDLFA